MIIERNFTMILRPALLFFAQPYLECSSMHCPIPENLIVLLIESIIFIIVVVDDNGFPLMDKGFVNTLGRPSQKHLL
jgi:hypothetical protein